MPRASLQRAHNEKIPIRTQSALSVRFSFSFFFLSDGWPPHPLFKMIREVDSRNIGNSKPESERIRFGNEDGLSRSPRKSRLTVSTITGLLMDTSGDGWRSDQARWQLKTLR